MRAVYAELDHEYYIVELNYSLPEETYQWLKDQFGPSGKRWFCSLKKIYFADKRDHFMFTLRWA